MAIMKPHFNLYHEAFEAQEHTRGSAAAAPNFSDDLDIQIAQMILRDLDDEIALRKMRASLH